MSRDLAPEVDKHLKSQNPYLRKKACLAMARCLAKCPDMVEDFVDRVVTLLKDKSHGVLMPIVQLMTTVLMVDYKFAEEEGEDPFQTDCRKAFLRLAPTLVKMLRNLVTNTGFSPEHDVGGVADPFLQVQLLTLLRLLGSNNVEASEQMNDVLAQVATNTETAKNAGNAILYECVQTIMGTESEDGLRVLAVNILGRFLLNRDNNIRYVALNTLSRCIQEQKQLGRDDDMLVSASSSESANNAMSALQRHRQTVVDCLKDPDISIRQRALELIYHLVNENNVEQLTAELLNYLVLCPREHKSDICNRVLKVVDRFSPNDRWRVDTLITTLTIAGREANNVFQSATAVYISRADRDTHAFAAHKLLKAIRDDDGSQTGLLAVGIWCIGEYGDLLLQPCTYIPQTSDTDDLGMASQAAPVTLEALAPLDVVATVERITEQRGCKEHIKNRALTTYAKLSQRFAQSGDSAALNKINNLLGKHSTSRSLELQLRSCEYLALISAAKGVKQDPIPKEDDIFGVTGNGDSTVSPAVMQAAQDAIARMPVVDLKVLEKRLAAENMEEGGAPSRPPRATASAPAKSGDLLNLDDMFGSTPAAPVQNGTAAAPALGSGKSDFDLLSEVFSSQTTSAPAPAIGFDPFSAPTLPAATPAVSNPMDLFGSVPANPPAMSMPQASNPTVDLFGVSSPVAPAPAVQASTAIDFFGAAPIASTPAPAPSKPRVFGFSHNGLSAEFEYHKPDPMNAQRSELVACFKNTTGAPVHGLNLQVAVPKYVQMQMDPPSSTTVPVSGGNAKEVTQKLVVTNTMLGSKNLMLKVKVSFTANGQKTEHMATVSGFPAGEY
jgi:AP-1 complex subunit gamma-1